MGSYGIYLDFAEEVAINARELMRKYYTSSNPSMYKADATIVTEADKAINHMLIEMVKERFPKHQVQGEEESTDNVSDYVWVCDPIDGTAMFARHIPVSVFSLALVERGKSVVGVVVDPFQDEMYTAVKGEGAYLNGKKISVSDTKLDKMKSVVNFDNWPGAGYNVDKLYEKLAKKAYVVQIGSVIHASMNVARGDFVAAIFPGTVGKNCDIAAVKVIVEEAGGIVKNFNDRNDRYDYGTIFGAIISNAASYEKLLRMVEKYAKVK